MKTLRRLAAVVLFGAAFWAAYRLADANASLVVVDLLYLETPATELWIVLVAAFGLGAVIAGLGLSYEIARLGLLSRRYRKSVGRLETEIHQLRNLPVEGADPDPGELRAAAGGSAPGPIG